MIDNRMSTSKVSRRVLFRIRESHAEPGSARDGAELVAGRQAAPNQLRMQSLRAAQTDMQELRTRVFEGAWWYRVCVHSLCLKQSCQSCLVAGGPRAAVRRPSSSLSMTRVVSACTSRGRRYPTHGACESRKRSEMRMAAAGTRTAVAAAAGMADSRRTVAGSPSAVGRILHAGPASACRRADKVGCMAYLRRTRRMAAAVGDATRRSRCGRHCGCRSDHGPGCGRRDHSRCRWRRVGCAGWHHLVPAAAAAQASRQSATVMDRRHLTGWVAAAAEQSSCWQRAA